jgi:hypothetical protein
VNAVPSPKAPPNKFVGFSRVGALVRDAVEGEAHGAYEVPEACVTWTFSGRRLRPTRGEALAALAAEPALPLKAATCDASLEKRASARMSLRENMGELLSDVILLRDFFAGVGLGVFLSCEGRNPFFFIDTKPHQKAIEKLKARKMG